jgi:hypothetical protein
MRTLGAWFLALGLAGVACGGGAPRDSQTPDQAEETEAASSAAEESAGETASAEVPAREDPCSDGGCFSCGESVCLTGWYCDENAKGGTGCSWLPDCATNPTCRCLTKVLGSECSCNEDAGGPRVSCG